MTFRDQKNLVFLACAVTYIITGLPAFGLILWLIIAYDDYTDFIYTKTNKGHNHKILTLLHFLSVWSSLIMGVTAFTTFGGWWPIIIRLILFLLVWFFNNSDDDWDDKLDKLKDSVKSVFWMGRYRNSTTVSLA
jgi:K+ transporter